MNALSYKVRTKIKNVRLTHENNLTYYIIVISWLHVGI